MTTKTEKLNRVRIERFSDLDNLSIGSVTEVKMSEDEIPEHSDWFVYEGVINNEYAFMQQSENNLKEILSWRLPKKFIVIGNYGEIVISSLRRDIKSYTPENNEYKEKVKLLESAKMWEGI